jgi:hypothetical protein
VICCVPAAAAGCSLCRSSCLTCWAPLTRHDHRTWSSNNSRLTADLVATACARASAQSWHCAESESQAMALLAGGTAGDGGVAVSEPCCLSLCASTDSTKLPFLDVCAVFCCGNLEQCFNSSVDSDVSQAVPRSQGAAHSINCSALSTTHAYGATVSAAEQQHAVATTASNTCKRQAD